MEDFFKKYASQIIEKCEDGSDFQYSGKSVVSLISMMSEEFNNLVDAKTDNNVFVWKEDGTGVEYVQAFFNSDDSINIDNEFDAIDIQNNYDIYVIKRQ